MSTIFNIRNIKLPSLSRATLVAGTVVVVLAIAGAVVGYQVYQRLTNTTVVAYFSQALALYPGDKVQIMGLRVGSIDSIDPDGDKMKVTFHYDTRYKVPANATASVLNPSLVASRTIELSPPYSGGPVMQDGAVIPLERTQVPVEWDDLRDQVTHIVSQLGPTPQQPKGPFGDIIESFADGLAGKGQQINSSLISLSQAVTALNDSRGDFFATVKSLALFVNALHNSDQQFVALNDNLATFTGDFTNSDQEVANAIGQVDQLLSTTRHFVSQNGDLLTRNINNLAEVTTAIVQPDPRDGLETALHVLPHFGSGVLSIYQPAHGALTGVPAITNFANPMQFICSAIQAGSRLGYQDSAELCAQYLAPVLDAIKFNFPPFGMVPFGTAAALPKHITYSEDRLRPPPGYKDTTVPGVFSRDTLFSHGNNEPGWVVAPGMQGVDVQPATANMLTPDSLAELLGGPDIVAPPAPPAFGAPPGGNLPGPPNAYDENNPLPPPWYPQPLPSPAPAPAPAPDDGPLPAEAGR